MDRRRNPRGTCTGKGSGHEIKYFLDSKRLQSSNKQHPHRTLLTWRGSTETVDKATFLEALRAANIEMSLEALQAVSDTVGKGSESLLITFRQSMEQAASAVKTMRGPAIFATTPTGGRRTSIPTCLSLRYRSSPGMSHPSQSSTRSSTSGCVLAFEETLCGNSEHHYGNDMPTTDASSITGSFLVELEPSEYGDETYYSHETDMSSEDNLFLSE
jgi:hypothetical protein